MFVYMNELHGTLSQNTAVIIMAAVFWDFRFHKRRLHVLRFFGFFGDTENAELREQKVHRRCKCLLSYGTSAALPLVWCVVEIIMKRDPLTWLQGRHPGKVVAVHAIKAYGLVEVYLRLFFFYRGIR
jgi:hypothetical protein